MVLYRVLQNIAWGGREVKRGGMDTLLGMSAKSLRVLQERGAIAPVIPPPLSALPGWSIRANRLAKVGIVTVLDLLEAEMETVKAACRVSDATAERWKAEARGWLTGPPAKGG